MSSTCAVKSREDAIQEHADLVDAHIQRCTERFDYWAFSHNGYRKVARGLPWGVFRLELRKGRR